MESGKPLKMIENNLPDFGVNQDDLICFRARLPSDPSQNQRARMFVRDGIELFEIPKENLGFPLDLLVQLNTGDVLALYIGAGELKTHEVINYGDGILQYDDLLKKDPWVAVSYLVSAGQQYNGTHIMNKRGFTEHSTEPFALQNRVREISRTAHDKIMQTLTESRKTRYETYIEMAPPIPLIMGLVAETYAMKNGMDFWFQTGNGRYRRTKTRSESKNREGTLYETKEMIVNPGPDQTLIYSCTCPAMNRFRKAGKECKHINEMKGPAA